MLEAFGIQRGKCGHAWIVGESCPFCAKEMPGWGVHGEDEALPSQELTELVARIDPVMWSATVSSSDFPSFAPEIPVTPELGGLVPFEPGNKWYVGFDPANGSDQSAIVFAKRSSDGSLVIHDMKYGSETGIRVTPEMRRIGGDCLSECREMEVFHEQAAEAAYRAMAALAPVELVSEGELQAVRERDEAREQVRQKTQCIDQLLAWNTRHLEENRTLRAELADARLSAEVGDSLIDKNCALSATNERLRDEIAALTVEKALLHDMMTQFTTSNVSDFPSEPKHNPFRVPARDPRRMGR